MQVNKTYSSSGRQVTGVEVKMSKDEAYVISTRLYEALSKESGWQKDVILDFLKQYGLTGANVTD